MSGKNLIGGQNGPKTQSIDAVKALLSFKKVASDPLPNEGSLDSGRLVMVLSNKKDAFYTVTDTRVLLPRRDIIITDHASIRDSTSPSAQEGSGAPQ
jgi:hypothetical protein